MSDSTAGQIDPLLPRFGLRLSSHPFPFPFHRLPLTPTLLSSSSSAPACRRGRRASASRPPMDQSALHAGHRSSRSAGDAQEETQFDGEEASLLGLTMETMAPTSADCGRIAQDEDEDGERSGTQPSSLDGEEHYSDKNPPLDEDECSDEDPPWDEDECSDEDPNWDEDEHSDEIGVHAIGDRREEQGRSVSHAQALLDMDDHTIGKKIIYCLSQLKYNAPEDHFYQSLYEPQQLHELNLRLALYRIRGYDYEVCVDRKFAGMDDATLAALYPPCTLYDEGYFEHYEESLDWYFDPHLCKYSGFDDYQRLVLRNYGEYADWDRYVSTLHTYEKDQAYVQYCEAMANETKWVEDCLMDGSIPSKKIEKVARLQSMKVAAGFPNVLPSLLTFGFEEHMWKVHADIIEYKGADGVYFEIWKQVAKRKMDFKEALSEVYQERMFPIYRRLEMKLELEKPFGLGSMKDKYDAYVACIGDSVSDEQALTLITEAVKKCPETKTYVDYAKMKLKIAEEIGLITKGVSIVSNSSSRSGDAPPFDGEETSLLGLTMDKKPKPSCSGDCGRIAHDEDEDEHCDKKPSSVDEDENSDQNPSLDEDECSGENPPWDEDEHYDEIGVHAIEDQREEQGRAVSHAQALLDMDNDTIEDKVHYYFSQLKYNGPEDPFYWSLYEPEELPELNQRLALYRIKGYDYEACVDRKFAGMDDATLAQQYPPSTLYDEGYFRDYEEFLEWYFDPDLYKYAGFDDYQRLVLRNYGEYGDWDSYKSTFHTYEIDLAYVQYYKAMENETKWIEDCMVDGLIPYEKIENMARLQSMKIAAGFPNLRPRLFWSGFQEYMWKVRADFHDYKGLDGVYFEIWKRVTKQQIDFTEALSEVYHEGMFPHRSLDMETELENPMGICSMKSKYDSYVACIGDSVSDDQALQLITEAVKKMTPGLKIYADYAKKKLQIAEEIGLTPKVRRTEVAWKSQGDTGEATSKIDN